MGFKLMSDGILNGIILDQYGKRSEDQRNGVPQLSIPLHWSGAPDHTKTFAIVMEDFENIKDEGISWIHWLIANIPGDVTRLEEDFSRRVFHQEGSIVQGKNTWILQIDSSAEECNRYGGPAPEKTSHEYEFKIYALDKYLKLENGFFYDDFRKEIRGAVLAEAELFAEYPV